MPRSFPSVRVIRQTFSGSSHRSKDKDDDKYNNKEQQPRKNTKDGRSKNSRDHNSAALSSVCKSHSTTASLTEGDADWIVRKTETRVAETVAKSHYIQKNCRLYKLPRFSHEDLELGQLLASGGFCEVREIKRFLVASELDRCAGSSSSSSSRYVIKSLAPKLVSKPKQLSIGAKDLVMEGFVLSSLHHENILQVKGFASSGVSGYASTGRIDGFFLVLPRLDKTLHKQLYEWKIAVKKQQRLALLHNSSKSKSDGSDGSAETRPPSHPFLPDYEDASSSESDLEESEEGISGSSSNGEAEDDFHPDNFPFFTPRIQTAVEIASAIAYCHRNRILYRDLKPANAGYCFAEDRVKLFDFGLAVELPPSVDPEKTFKLPGNTGTARYMAPEVIQAIPYGLKADVFSFCMLLHEIMALVKPFDKLEGKAVKEQVAELGRRPPIDKSWPISVRRLLRRGFSDVPQIRPTMEEVQDVLEDLVDCF